ncbi:inositol monophosphatase family protein [Candidatus Harpocratesius sp.]
MNFSTWTNHLIDAGKKAFYALTDIYGTELARRKLSVGAGGDITAYIDKVAENIIISSLESLKKPFVMISEEIGIYFWDGNNRHTISSLDKINLDDYPPLYIILDPVDGSSNAMRGIPFSCVSIAIATQPRISAIEIGVLISLQTGDEYVAEKGKGAYLNGKKIFSSLITDIHKAVLGTDLDSSEMCKDLIIQNENLFRSVSKRRILGSCALELGFISAGFMDLYFDVRGVLRIVDIAAGILILSEAGGFIMNSKGESISDEIFTLKSKYNLIAGCPGLYSIMVKILKNS